MKSIKIKGLLATAMMLPMMAHAVPIDGNISIGGAVIPTCQPTEGDQVPECTLASASGLDFLDSLGAGGPGGTGTVNPGATGDFAGLVGEEVAMNDFLFDPLSTNNPLWSVGGFIFELETIEILFEADNFLVMEGTGVISFWDDTNRSEALDPTEGVWSMSIDSSNGIDFGWSSTNATVAPVPEPAVLVLMGLGLIGGLGARRLTRI